MFKFIKRMLIFLVVSFFCINIVIFFILNSQIIQHTIVQYLNENYFKNQKLELKLGSLNVNFFDSSLNINDVLIIDKSNNLPTNESFVKLDKISIYFDILSSYMNRIPVINKVSLGGGGIKALYNEKNNLILPEFLLNILNNEDDTEDNIQEFLSDVYKTLNFQTELVNFHINLGDENSKNFQKISINKIFINKDKNFKQNNIFKINLSVGNSILVFPFHPQLTSITSINLNGNIATNGDVSFKNFEILSNLFQLKSEIQGVLAKKIENSSYILNIKQLDVNSKDVFQLLDMKASGRAILSGFAVSGKKITDEPVFNGSVSWKNFILEDFNIYSGTAQLVFKDSTIDYSNAVIHSNKSGIIKAKGKFQLFNDFHFENIADIEKLKFSELLNGLGGVSYTPLDFLINSKSLNINGNIFSKNPKKIFDLYIKGNASAENLFVTEFKDHNVRKPLPNLSFNLNMEANALSLIFDKSNLVVNDSKKNNIGNIQILNGLIDLTPVKGVGADFKINGTNISLIALDYFLKQNTSGLANFKGELKVAPGSTDVVFTSDAHIYEGDIIGIKFKEYKGVFGINSKMFWLKNAVATLSNFRNNKTVSVLINEVNSSFLDFKTKINLSAQQTYFDVLAYSFSSFLPPEFQNLKGESNKFILELDGILFDPSSWNLKFTTNANQFEIVNSLIKNVNISLNCSLGVCINSAVSLFNIKSKDEPYSGEDSSFILFEIQKLSFEYALFRAKINKLPLSAFSGIRENKFSGTFSSNIQLSGKWNNLFGVFSANGYNVKYQDYNLGNFSLNIFPNENKNFRVSLNSFNNQVILNYIIPQNSEGSSLLSVDMKNFDPTIFLGNQTRSENSLFSQVNARFQLSGDSPFDAKKNKNWFKTWKGSGLIETINFQIGKIVFALNRKSDLSFNGDDFNLNELNFNSEFGKIEISKFSYRISDKKINSNIFIDYYLNKLEQVSDIFSASEGTLRGRVKIDGTLDRLKTAGSLNLQADLLSLKSFQPSFKNLRGKIIFRDNKLEIQDFHAEKGAGDISIVGSVDLESLIDSDNNNSSILFRISARNTDLKLQIPVFQNVDTNFNANISISGNQRPYLINGDIIVNKLRIFKDIACNEIANEFISQSNLSTPQSTNLKPFANLNVNLQALSSLTLQTQCSRGKFSTNPSILITGDTVNPILVGSLTTEVANLFLMKTRFDVKKADFNFIELQKYDPNVDIQLESRVSNYTVFVNLLGKFSTPRFDLSIQPSTLPNGDRITQGDIISIISTGQIPLQSSSANLLSASTSMYSFFGGSQITQLGFLNNTLNTVTGGLVDNMSIIPTSQNGQLSWRVTVSRSLSERLNLGVSYQGESGDVGSTSSASATFLLNNTISLFSSFSSSNPSISHQQTTTEVTGGLRFRFGSQ